MNKNVNIAVVGLGQIGGYLLAELYKKKNEIKIKKGNLKLIKKYFIKIHLIFLNSIMLIFCLK